MTAVKSAILKTCSICGQQKPLAAFLQLAGPGGTTYGNVCAPCRKEQATAAKTTEHDDATTRHSGLEISAEARLEIERNKAEHFQKVEEDYFEEREERETERQILNVRREDKDKDKYRAETLLRNRNLFNTPKTAVETQRANIEKSIQEKKDRGLSFDVPQPGTAIAGQKRHTDNPMGKQAVTSMFGQSSSAAGSLGVKGKINKAEAPSEKKSPTSTTKKSR